MQLKQPFYQKPERERNALIRKNIEKGHVRCTHCGKKFFEGCLGHGTHIELKCPRCKEFIKINIT